MGCPPAALRASQSRPAPGAAPARSRKGQGGQAGWGPWAPGLGGRPAWATLGGRRCSPAPTEAGPPAPLRPWRGRAAWAASRSCSWQPSRRRWRSQRTRRSCPSPWPGARPAGHARRPPRPSSSPARPQLSTDAFGFSAASRISDARRGLGKCAQVAVGSSLLWPPGARRCLEFLAGSAQPHFFSSVTRQR